MLWLSLLLMLLVGRVELIGDTNLVGNDLVVNYLTQQLSED